MRPRLGFRREGLATLFVALSEVKWVNGRNFAANEMNGVAEAVAFKY